MKRPYVRDEKAPPAKRFRSDEDQPKHQVVLEDITHARQLRNLLTFRQDAIPELRTGIASFKAFLEKILYDAGSIDLDSAKNLLKEYLDSERPRQGEEIEHPFLSQLWLAWSFANSNNNDHLASAVCAVLALLLKTLSSSLDFRDHGMLLCRTVTQHQHLRHIKRCLDAPKHKEFLLSPSLRLLTEVATFDGGVNVRELYKRREQTFDLAALRKCLALTKPYDANEEEARRRPAVRTLAVRYILAHLKYQDEGAKIDILRQRPLINALFGFLRADPPELVIEVLRTAESSVLKDDSLPRTSKIALLSEQQLSRVLEIATRSEVESVATPVAFQWLKAAITKPSHGILRFAGWYKTVAGDMQHTIDPVLIKIDDNTNQIDGDLPVRNVILASWIKDLKPSSSLLERELILACFDAAPELVHSYFAASTLQMDPKLTVTWLGYASFMFEVACLPVPSYLGSAVQGFAEHPPRLEYIINSIVPKPMTNKVLTRCLTQSSNLVALFAVRLLIIALGKLKHVLDDSLTATNQSKQKVPWLAFRRKLVADFTRLVPTAKDVANLYRRLPAGEEHYLEREAAAKLLRLYAIVLPDSAAEDSFDISSAFLTLLDKVDQASHWQTSELGNLLIVAQHNTTLKWFQKQGASSFSPIVTLLRAALPAAAPLQYRNVARAVLEADYILTRAEPGRLPPFDALVSSLQSVSKSSIVWQSLDDYLARASKSPVKYLDILDTVKQDTKTRGEDISLLVAVMIEQASFVIEKNKKERKELIHWYNQTLHYLSLVSGDKTLIQLATRRITAIDGWMPGAVETESPESLGRPQQDESATSEETITSDPLPFDLPEEEKADHPELFRWQRKELELAIDDNDVDSLIFCLSSAYPEVRKQAQGQIEALSNAIRASALEEKEQLYLVVGELLETYRTSYYQEDKALPYLLSTFAVRAVHVQLEPTHLLYSKLNRFLMKGPIWRSSSLSKYWLTSTTMDVPTDDAGYWSEVRWTIDWLVDGMRGQADFDLLRQAGSFERLLAVYVSAGSAHKQIKTRILELFYRAALIDATTLITRAGLLTWLETVEGDIPQRLRSLLKEKCDAQRLEAWAGVSLEVA